LKIHRSKIFTDAFAQLSNKSVQEMRK
jgi:E3 ubiquitin-protein ligase HUWE1